MDLESKLDSCNIDDAVEGLIQVIKFGRNNKVYNIGNNKESDYY